MNGIIIYRTTYGSTKKYAEWIAEETGFALYSSADPEIPWGDANPIVIGCSIMAYKPTLSSWIAKNQERMEGKAVYLFTTSGADPKDAPLDEWIQRSLPESMRHSVRCFPLAGRFHYADLTGPHKAMIWIAANVLGNKDVRTQMRNPVDGVKKENLAGLLEQLR